MGYLHYGESHKFEFEDRALTHIRTVVLAKLNMQESLVFTWVDHGCQRSVWFDPAIPLHFEFTAATSPELNPEWVEQLLALANSSTGLRLTDEPNRSQ